MAPVSTPFFGARVPGRRSRKSARDATCVPRDRYHAAAKPLRGSVITRAMREQSTVASASETDTRPLLLLLLPSQQCLPSSMGGPRRDALIGW